MTWSSPISTGSTRRGPASSAAAEAAGPAPADQLVGLFGALDSACRRDGYRGCGFINAAAESAASTAAHDRTVAHKRKVRAWLRDLAEQAGAEHPERLARSLSLLARRCAGQRGTRRGARGRRGRAGHRRGPRAAGRSGLRATEPGVVTLSTMSPSAQTCAGRSRASPPRACRRQRASEDGVQGVPATVRRTLGPCRRRRCRGTATGNRSTPRGRGRRRSGLRWSRPSSRVRGARCSSFAHRRTRPSQPPVPLPGYSHR